MPDEIEPRVYVNAHWVAVQRHNWALIIAYVIALQDHAVAADACQKAGAL